MTIHFQSQGLREFIIIGTLKLWNERKRTGHRIRGLVEVHCELGIVSVHGSNESIACMGEKSKILTPVVQMLELLHT